jgi:hypothetical protein
MVIQSITKIQLNVSLSVLVAASMATAQNPINALAMLVISRIVRIPADVFHTVLDGVRMEYVLPQTHALAMKDSLLIRTQDVCHTVQEVVSMETALYSTGVIVSLAGLDQTVQFIISRQIQT